MKKQAKTRWKTGAEVWGNTAQQFHVTEAWDNTFKHRIELQSCVSHKLSASQAYW